MSEKSSRLLQASAEQISAIRKSVGLVDDEGIARDVDMVLEWFDKQQHLPRIKLDRAVVEAILVSRKGSVEQTKLKIDLMYTLRNLIPELATPRDILHNDIQSQFKAFSIGITPKLNHDHTRIIIFTFKPYVDEFDLSNAVRYLLMLIEYRLRYDYCTGDRYVCDYQNVSLSHITKLNPITLKNAELYLQKGYGTRIRGIHYINAPSYMGKILGIIKSALSEKLGQRLMVHPDLEDLHKYISKDCLPKDYGGNCDSVEKICDQWHSELKKEDIRRFLIEQETLKSDEKLRIGGKADDDALGIPGSFKKLSVD